MGVYVYYRYVPNKGAAIAFAVLFALATFASLIINLFLGRRCCLENTRNKNFRSVNPALRYYNTLQLVGAYFPLLVGGLLEIIGYAARSFSADKPTSLAPFVIQDILILIAPAFYAATIYMLFGRMAHLLLADRFLIMPPKYNTMIFVTGDVVSLVLQAAGGGLMAGKGTLDTGTGIVIGGLFVQIGFFGVFILNELLFLLKIKKSATIVSKSSRSYILLNNLLLISSILILIRSIVRAVEFIEGDTGTIMSNEWFLYVFDTTPIFLVSLLFLSNFFLCDIFMVQQESVMCQTHDNLPMNARESKIA